MMNEIENRCSINVRMMGVSAMSMSQTAACMVRMPQARIDGAVESFELVTAKGLWWFATIC